MKFTIRQQDDVAVVVLEGDMVGGPDATLLTEKIRDLLESGRTKILVDMSEVNWMNSSGLGILIGGLTTVRSSGGEMKFVHLSNKIRELLRITKLEGVFDLYDNEDEAVGSFA